MKVTATEAYQKYCPRRVSEHCLGKHCMGWRWTNETRPGMEEHPDRYATEEGDRPAHIPDDYRFVPANHTVQIPAHWIERNPPLLGYCGACGKPKM